MGDREVAMFKAPKLAMSGRFRNADEVIAALAPEVRRVQLAFSLDVRQQLDELCATYWKPRDEV